MAFCLYYIFSRCFSQSLINQNYCIFLFQYVFLWVLSLVNRLTALKIIVDVHLNTIQKYLKNFNYNVLIIKKNV